MHSHPNARLSQKRRLRLVNQHPLHYRLLAELAAEAGISLRCAYKWLARYYSAVAAALADRRSVRRSPPVQERCHPSDLDISGLEDMTNASIQRGRQC